MVTVKLFGTFRLESGIRQMQAEAADVKSLYPLLIRQAKRNNPDTRVKLSDVKGCYVFVNGVQANSRARLRDGDEVMLMTPVSGG